MKLGKHWVISFALRRPLCRTVRGLSVTLGSWAEINDNTLLRFNNNFLPHTTTLKKYKIYWPLRYNFTLRYVTTWPVKNISCWVNTWITWITRPQQQQRGDFIITPSVSQLEFYSKCWSRTVYRPSYARLNMYIHVSWCWSVARGK